MREIFQHIGATIEKMSLLKHRCAVGSGACTLLRSSEILFELFLVKTPFRELRAAKQEMCYETFVTNS